MVSSRLMVGSRRRTAPCRRSFSRGVAAYGYASVVGRNALKLRKGAFTPTTWLATCSLTFWADYCCDIHGEPNAAPTVPGPKKSSLGMGTSISIDTRRDGLRQDARHEPFPNISGDSPACTMSTGSSKAIVRWRRQHTPIIVAPGIVATSSDEAL